jgi:ChrR Cupin-like domain
MSKPTLEFHMPEAAWLPGDVQVPGIWTQALSLDGETGNYTGLIRYEAGVDTTPIGERVHDYWEEVYLLEGDITDLRLNETFTSGMYACRPPGMPHGPWRTEQGVLMLEFRYSFRRA